MPPFLPNRSRRSANSLHVVPIPGFETLPSVEDLLGRAEIRRPGELHEALHLSRPAAQRVASAAAEATLAIDVAGTILLEAALVVMDAADAGRALATPARGPVVRRALPAAEADYLRSITMRRPPCAAGPPPTTISVPVRLTGRLVEIDAEAALVSVEIEIALAWEIAAVAAGRTMSEWALWTLLSVRSAS
jgi:hypothetical protein